MKKLLTLIAAGALATAANAMAVNWTFYDDGSAFADENVYMLLGSTAKTDWTSEAQISAAAVGTSYIDYGQALGISKDAAITKTEFDAYWIITTADGYYVSGPTTIDGTEYVYDPDDRESAKDPFEWGTSDSLSEKYEYKGVPEPTSGLLLLLGVAGLALRRRRA